MIHLKEKWTNILLYLIAYLPILIFFNLIFIDVCSWKLSLGLSSLHFSFIPGVHVFLHHHEQPSCSMTAPKYICQTLLPNCLKRKEKKKDFWILWKIGKKPSELKLKLELKKISKVQRNGEGGGVCPLSSFLFMKISSIKLT